MSESRVHPNLLLLSLSWPEVKIRPGVVLGMEFWPTIHPSIYPWCTSDSYVLSIHAGIFGFRFPADNECVTASDRVCDILCMYVSVCVCFWGHRKTLRAISYLREVEASSWAEKAIRTRYLCSGRSVFDEWKTCKLIKQKARSSMYIRTFGVFLDRLGRYQKGPLPTLCWDRVLPNHRYEVPELDQRFWQVTLYFLNELDYVCVFS